MIGLITQIGEAIFTILNTIVDFFVGLVRWIPLMARITSSSAGMWGYVPATLLPISTIVCVFCCVKMLIYGGDSK